MSSFGFSPTWVNWIEQILILTKLSILINGGPRGFFGVESGLCQGDPLSPMLFILAEEALCRSLRELRDTGFVKPIPGPRNIYTPSHILYADDLFIFINADLKGVRSIKNFLDIYQSYLGQNINLKKSKIFLGTITSGRRHKIKEILNILICDFPTRYLGVDIFRGCVKKERILPLVDKCKSRLVGWKGRLLSFVGRVELVKTVMSSIPLHNFSVYLWPSSSISLMERWIKIFIWSGDADTSKGITVKWTKVCKPKSEGGLGIRHLRDVNLALLSKLSWHMCLDPSIFSSILRGRLMTTDGNLKRYAPSSSIISGLQKVWDFVSNSERWIVGDGATINFWYDRWISSSRLFDEIFHHQPINYRLMASVSDFISDGHWNLPTLQSRLMQSICNHGFFKLNIDGCSLGNPGNSGAGGILRDERGNGLGCFAIYEGVGTNFMVEFAAFFHGLKLASTKGFQGDSSDGRISNRTIKHELLKPRQ
ncbi:uncharacterized protein LOC122060837 [Macadamia integrifolia]|uniref:uncharacterized protein LOC122060837 n=1 Tax=Macadamia integrifolia TaxID=60698 RepID=UPI001C52FDF1|nr:uncharacterized protein LOC122060837 [Macadamia integrifolia]